MITKFVLPTLAVLGAGGAILSSLRAAPAADSVAAPAAAHFRTRIAGGGLVESSGQEIQLAAPLAEVVGSIAATTGALVAAGDLLLRLDDRLARAALAQAEAELATAKARLADLLSLPRADDLPPAEARVTRARAERAIAGDRLARAERADGALGDEELVSRRLAEASASAALVEAEADLIRLRNGPTTSERRVREAEVEQAQRLVESRLVELGRHTVRAPVFGTVLRIDAKPGEYATPGGSALLVLGDISVLHVRAQVDERDAGRLSASAAAVAIPRGQPGHRLALTFVRIDPLVRPKRSLTGDVSERVDTRVLEAIYRLEPGSGLHPGQQVDVEIEVAP